MQNKIYQVVYDDDTDTICAPSESEAINHCVEYNGLLDTDIKSCVEVPESEWETHKVKIWEDNDTTNEPYFMTYKELHTNIDIEIICSTNMDWL